MDGEDNTEKDRHDLKEVSQQEKKGTERKADRVETVRISHDPATDSGKFICSLDQQLPAFWAPWTGLPMRI